MSKLLNINQVVERVGICKTTIYDMMNKGQFPSAVKPTPTMTRWRERDLDKWDRELSVFIGTQSGSDNEQSVAIT